jgi:tetratricopeptide (TPR) repeat protein
MGLNAGDCWTVLGLDGVSDIKTVKRAYAQRLKRTRPEDDPEGFLVLREAYEEALATLDGSRSQPKHEVSTASPPRGPREDSAPAPVVPEPTPARRITASSLKRRFRAIVDAPASSHPQWIEALATWAAADLELRSDVSDWLFAEIVRRKVALPRETLLLLAESLPWLEDELRLCETLGEEAGDLASALRDAADDEHYLGVRIFEVPDVLRRFDELEERRRADPTSAESLDEDLEVLDRLQALAELLPEEYVPHLIDAARLLWPAATSSLGVRRALEYSGAVVELIRRAPEAIAEPQAREAYAIYLGQHADSLSMVNEHDAAYAAIDEALEMMRALGDATEDTAEELARLMSTASEIYQAGGRLDEAAGLAAEAVDVLRQASAENGGDGLEESIVEALVQQARLETERGHEAIAIAHLQEAEALAMAADELTQLDVRTAWAECLTEMGRYDEAVDQARAALDFANEIDQVPCALQMGVVILLFGNTTSQELRSYADLLSTLSQQMHLAPSVLGVAELSRAIAFMHDGAPQRAHALFQAWSPPEPCADLLGVSYFTWSARCQLELRRSARAIQDVERAMTIFTEIDDGLVRRPPHLTSLLRDTLGRVAAEGHDVQHHLDWLG